MSSHCDAFRAQLANWGWLPGEPLNWLKCSVPDFSDMKYQTCCFMYACRNQQQCDCGWCFCGSQRVLLLSFVECCLSWLWINHQEVSEYRNCYFWWLQGQLQIFLAWKAWSFIPMNTILTLSNSRLLFFEAFTVKTATLAVQSTTEYISVIVLTLCSPCCLSPAQKQSRVCWIYAKRRTLLQFWQSYEGLCLFFSSLLAYGGSL